LLASGEAISPREAARIGLVNRLVPCEEAVEATDRFAQHVAAAAPLAIAAAKRAVREGSSLPLANALALEAKLVDELYDTDDAREGFNAAIEKRSPDYRGT
jgi:enoyl-CoA hydratase/carnithine racemase